MKQRTNISCLSPANSQKSVADKSPARAIGTPYSADWKGDAAYEGDDCDYGAFGWYDSYPGIKYYNSATRRPHDASMDRAYFSKWTDDLAKGYQYLADAYNEHVRKTNEPPLLPPPAGL